MGPLSRPLIRSGQGSQTTTGISQPVARLSVFAPADELKLPNVERAEVPGSRQSVEAELRGRRSQAGA